MSPTETDWIADGTDDVEPVTVETPDATVEATEAETAAPAEPEASTEPEAVEEVAAEAEEVAEVVQKFIEGRLGDEVFQIPEDLLVPQKRGDTIEYVPFVDVQKQGMMGKDYSAKTTELAQMRRAVDGDRETLTREQVRLDARAKYVDDQKSEIEAALKDPKSAAAYEEHLTQYQNNEMYRKNVDAALSQHETQAELEALQATEDRRIVGQGVEAAFGWIESLKGEYEGIDPERVRQEYSRRLKAGEASLDISSVRTIYEAEKDYVTKTVSPLQSQLADITAQLKVLQDGAAATQHNEKTQHAVKRAKTTPVATGPGAPAKSADRPTKFEPRELGQRNSAWIAEGR